jgi:putative transcriptional regulator
VFFVLKIILIKRYKNAIIMLAKGWCKAMALSDEIILIRKKGFCTQIEFAERIGVSFSTVNRWETGKMSPSVSTMKRLKVYCDGLNIEFDNVEKAWLEKMLDHDDKKK